MKATKSPGHREIPQPGPLTSPAQRCRDVSVTTHQDHLPCWDAAVEEQNLELRGRDKASSNNGTTAILSTSRLSPHQSGPQQQEFVLLSSPGTISTPSQEPPAPRSPGSVFSRDVAGQLWRLKLSGDRRGKYLRSRLLFDCISHSTETDAASIGPGRAAGPPQPAAATPRVRFSSARGGDRHAPMPSPVTEEQREEGPAAQPSSAHRSGPQHMAWAERTAADCPRTNTEAQPPPPSSKESEGFLRSPFIGGQRAR